MVTAELKSILNKHFYYISNIKNQLIASNKNNLDNESFFNEVIRPIDKHAYYIKK